VGKRIRVEHWSNALNGGPAAARSMAGEQVVYDQVPYFFSDQYDLGMEYAGYVDPGGYDSVVFRGDPGSYEFIAFWVKDGRVLAGMNANIWDVQDDIQALVRAGYAGRPVDLARLADPAVALGNLLLP
jgi:NADPH-dependent 2,4-dienoyl-CoA reductase/sulfur reductase-like enzyme